jgi:endonuclease/exonuclease/phosphatase family metal-dependent hydrolase
MEDAAKVAQQNESLYTAADLKHDYFYFSFMTYNVDMAMREEGYHDTCWGNRCIHVRDLINVVDADVVCLQELRHLPQNPTITNPTPTVNEFLASLKKYNWEIGYRNASKLAFGQAILYDPAKFYAKETRKFWLSDVDSHVSDTWSTNPAGFGSLVLMAKLMPVMEGKLLTNVQPVWVVNVHFVLDEDVKTKSCYKLREIVDRECGDTPFIVCGDFNFFPDRDAAKQREILESGWMDVGKTYGQRTNRGVPIEGTFLGYEHDQFKSPLGVENLHSRLDNI